VGVQTRGKRVGCEPSTGSDVVMYSTRSTGVTFSLRSAGLAARPRGDGWCYCIRVGYISTTGLPRWRPRAPGVETLFYSKGDGCVHHRPSAAYCTTWKIFGRGFKEGIPRTAFCPKNMPAHALPWTHCVLFRGCEYFPPYSRSLY
jgi:hypothetical protein